MSYPEDEGKDYGKDKGNRASILIFALIFTLISIRCHLITRVTTVYRVSPGQPEQDTSGRDFDLVEEAVKRGTQYPQNFSGLDLVAAGAE